MAIEDKLRDIIVTSLKYDGSRGRFTDDFPLIDSHMIDSLDMLTLVSVLEEEFGLEITDEDFVQDNFGTINFEVVDELPRTPTGKLKRFVLRGERSQPT